MERRHEHFLEEIDAFVRRYSPKEQRAEQDSHHKYAGKQELLIVSPAYRPRFDDRTQPGTRR